MMLHITGGTYFETCQFPEWNEVFGSGLRAAAAVRGLGGDVVFYTYVSKDGLPALNARALDLQIETRLHPIPKSVSFQYVHGFSTPEILPPPHFLKRDRQPALEVDGDSILRFGFIEGDARVKGKRVVYDPQNPHEPEAFEANGSTADCLAIVCNKAEGRAMTGERTAESIAEKLLGKDGCRVVVVKCGSLGAVVAESSTVVRVPAFETEDVWPIGSGDVFAAVFAYEWANKSAPAVDAAMVASKATAFYCEKKHLRFPSLFPQGFENRALPAMAQTPQKRVYLAGPFFSIGQIWLVNEARAALQSQGFDVFSPLHHVGRGLAHQIYDPDIDGIKQSDIVFALVDGLDAGTLFEIGYAKAIGKEVVAFVQNEKPEDLKMLEGSKCLIQRDFVTAVYKASWLANKPE